MRRIMLVGLLMGLFLSGCESKKSEPQLRPLPGKRIPKDAGGPRPG